MRRRRKWTREEEEELEKRRREVEEENIMVYYNSISSFTFFHIVPVCGKLTFFYKMEVIIISTYTKSF